MVARNLEAKSELGRQIVHLIVGILIIGGLAILWKFSAYWHMLALAITWFTLILYCSVINLHSRGIKTPIDPLFNYLGKRDRFAGEGALWYLLGVMLLLAFLDRFLYVISSVYILAVGDSIATIYSYKRGYKRSFFKGRTWLSYLAFFIFTLPLSIFAGVKIIPLIILCAVFESLDFRINDNFLIPVICAIYFTVF